MANTKTNTKTKKEKALVYTTLLRKRVKSIIKEIDDQKKFEINM